MSTSLHLVVQFYKPADQVVLERMLDCILRNLRLDCVSALSVVCENVRLKIDHPKVRLHSINRRATYSDLLRIVGQSPDVDATHFGLANTDILLPADISLLLENLSESRMVAAISRHEASGSLHPMPKVSQDVWVFKRHVPPVALLDSCNYHLGIAGCEHLFAMALHTHGYDMWNPCFDCKVVHADPDPRVVFAKRYYGAYLYVPPCRIADVGKVRPSLEVAIMRGAFEGLPVGL